jgi:hypothetical protein
MNNMITTIQMSHAADDWKDYSGSNTPIAIGIISGSTNIKSTNSTSTNSTSATNTNNANTTHTTTTTTDPTITITHTTRPSGSTNTTSTSQNNTISIPCVLHTNECTNHTSVVVAGIRAIRKARNKYTPAGDSDEIYIKEESVEDDTCITESSDCCYW